MTAPLRPHSPLAAFLIPLLLALASCSNLPQNADTQEAETPEQPVAATDKVIAKEKPPLKPFPPETLFDLLVAEFAGANQQYGLQLNRYHKQAFDTRDPGVVSAATWLAVQLNAQQQALELSQLWVEVAPQDTSANRIAGYYLAYNNQLDKALPYALQALRTEDREAVYAIARQLGEAKAEQHQSLRSTLGALVATGGRFNDLANNPHVILLDARLLFMDGDHEAAIARASTVQQPETERDSALLLIANAILEKDGLEAVLAHLEQQVALHPNSKRLRLMLAKQLAEKDVERSRAELVKLVEQFPDDPRLLHALAMFNMAKKLYSQAQPQFEQLLDSEKFRDNAHFQLGLLHEQAERLDEAIEHYRQVQAGNQYNSAITAQIRLLATTNRDDDLTRLTEQLLANNPDKSAAVYLDIAAVLAGNQHPKRALALLNTALDKHPQNGDLLYSRSMIYEQQGDSLRSHTDLRTIISQQPESANALNALGYSLSNSNDPADHAEAYQLVSKALELEPENPAILDSMGWALFRLQRLEEALPYLRRAFEQYPDPEVAAHLGEVLWQLGQHTEALDIWEQSLTDNPGKPSTSHVLETMKRLGATRVSRNQP